MRVLEELILRERPAFQLHVEEGHKGKVAELDGKYLAALEKAMQAASQDGRLKEALELRDEMNRVKEKRPLPETVRARRRPWTS